MIQKLTEKQIDKLYAFTQKHYVPYYDLQTELVDHLSNGIEAQWQENKKLAFEDALQVEFKKFGVFGFADLVTSRQKAMNKKYSKLVFKILKEYFTFPKMALTLFLSVLVYILLSLTSYRYEVVLGVSFGLMIVFLIQIIKRKLTLSRQNDKAKKIWLFEEVINNYGSFLGFSFLLPQVLNFSIGGISPLGSIIVTNTGLSICAVLIAIFLLLVYVLIWVIPDKAKFYISKEHPEYNLEQS